ncbi:hypothetical protein V6N13_109520 [Hibiscus sabdariffa]|uniref:Uncharacterized protein n=1 Tax=Hibiscus sabdariffa TaxID=183260 RepID=A0ABR2FQJ9_9ROSI
MATKGLVWLISSLLFAGFLSINSYASGDSARKTHVVYMGDRPKGEFSAATTHHSMLTAVLGRHAITFLF